MKHITRLDDVTIERIFGAEDAENETDDRFRQYFFFNKVFDNLNNDLPIRVLVGHKGIGKSALLRRAYLNDADNGRVAVWIRPADLTAFRTDPEAKDFNLLVEQWKRGLLASVASKVVEHLTSSQLKENDLDIITRSAKRFITSLSEALVTYVEKKFTGSSAAVVKSFVEKTEVHVYIDDIDRGWSASKSDIRNISALLNAIRDISGADQRIRFRIGLRSDVYFLVRTSDESTDKIERNVLWLTWSNHEILCVIAKRIETFVGNSTDQAQILKMSQLAVSSLILSKVIEPVFLGRGHWSKRPVHNVLLSLTRQRPRDLVKLMHAAAKNAFGSGNIVITSKNLEDAFVSYSSERLQDIINEFSTELPEIERLLLNFKPLKRTARTVDSYLFTTDQLVNRIKQIMQNTPLKFRNGRPVTPR